MFNVGNHSIRGTIRAKYLLADNVRYKQSRNGLILEFRNFRIQGKALEIKAEVAYRGDKKTKETKKKKKTSG